MRSNNTITVPGLRYRTAVTLSWATSGRLPERPLSTTIGHSAPPSAERPLTPRSGHSAVNSAGLDLRGLASTTQRAQKYVTQLLNARKDRRKHEVQNYADHNGTYVMHILPPPDDTVFAPKIAETAKRRKMGDAPSARLRKHSPYVGAL
jgi:hypothetical protein